MTGNPLFAKQANMRLVNLKKIRKERGLTQRGLAELAGTTAQNIANYERRHAAVRPPLDVVVRLATALGYPTVDAFLADATGDPNPQNRRAA